MVWHHFPSSDAERKLNCLLTTWITGTSLICIYKEVKRATGKRLKWLLEILVFLCETESVLKNDFGESESHLYEKYFKS